MREIKATHVCAFLDAVRWWPERATVRPQYRGLSVLEIIEAGKRENVPAPSAHTLNKHTQRLNVFFNGLVALDLMSKNPLKAIKPEIDTSTDLDTGRAFTQDELNAIFAPANFVPWAKKYPHRWWGLILGLYTGARVNEVAQLFVDDVRVINCVWGIFLWKNSRGQKIKNKASIRFVPLAQPELEADRLAISRLLEVLSPNAPWQRSLWAVGVVLAMEELYEGCAALRQGHLSEGSIRRMMSTLQKRVGLHPGFTAAQKALFATAVAANSAR